MRRIPERGRIQFASSLAEGEDAEPKRAKGVLLARQTFGMFSKFSYDIGVPYVECQQKCL